jgi:hypothetical protein
MAQGARPKGPRRMVMAMVVPTMVAGLFGCGSSPTTPTPPPPAAPKIAVFSDPTSSFSTSDVHDALDHILRFDSATSALIWAVDGRSFSGFSVSGLFIRDDKFFQVRFGTKDGERRAYFTETVATTICEVEIVGGQIVITPTNLTVPGAPGQPAASDAGALSALAVRAATGRYVLSFDARLDGILQPVSSLTVSSQELILVAHVEDSLGGAARSGSVTFEYCSFKGLPPNDITRADEAPKEACDTGSANWARLTSAQIDPGGCPGAGPGTACMDFGIVRIPRVVGFRFRFNGQGGGIASGVSAAENFTWTPAP